MLFSSIDFFYLISLIMKTNTALSRNQKILLSIIFVVAALSRFLFLDLQSFWYDELFTQWACSINDFGQFVGQAVLPEVHPPLYNISMYFWAKAFGVSEIALRLPSAIAGVLLVWSMYKLGSLSRGRSAGLLSAALTSVFWYPLYMSQEARSYIFVLLLSSVFMIYHIKIFSTAKEKADSPRWDCIMFVLSGIATMYIHYYAGMFVVLSMFFLFLLPREKFLKVLLLYVIIGLSYLPWLPTMYKQFSSHDSFWTGSFSPLALFGALDFITINYRIFSAFPLLLIALYLANKVMQRWKNQACSNENFFFSDAYLLLIITVPFALIYVLSFVHTPLFTGRYYSFAYPAFVVFLASAILKLTNKKIFQALMIAVIIVSSLYSIVRKENYYDTFKVDYRNAYHYMESVENSNRYPVLVQGFLFIKFPANLYAYYNISSSAGRQYLSFDGDYKRIGDVVSGLKSMQADTAWYLSDAGFQLGGIDTTVNDSFNILSVRHFCKLDLYQISLKDTTSEERLQK